MRRLIVKPLADADVRALLYISHQRFGASARRAYVALLRHAYTLLRSDPQRAGVASGESIASSVFLFHLRHARTRGVAPKAPRHIIVFTCDDATLTILRVLHESMDAPAHFSGEES